MEPTGRDLIGLVAPFLCKTETPFLYLSQRELPLPANCTQAFTNSFHRPTFLRMHIAEQVARYDTEPPRRSLRSPVSARAFATRPRCCAPQPFYNEEAEKSKDPRGRSGIDWSACLISAPIELCRVCR